MPRDVQSHSHGFADSIGPSYRTTLVVKDYGNPIRKIEWLDEDLDRVMTRTSYLNFEHLASEQATNDNAPGRNSQLIIKDDGAEAIFIVAPENLNF